MDQAVAQLGPLSAVVDLWSLDAAPTDSLTLASVEESTVFGSAHAMQLAKALPESTGKLWFVTRGAQAVVPGPVEVAQGPLWAFARVIGLEYPDIWGGLLDIDPADSLEAQANSVFGEIKTGGSEDQAGVAKQARPPEVGLKHF